MKPLKRINQKSARKQRTLRELEAIFARKKQDLQETLASLHEAKRVILEVSDREMEDPAEAAAPDDAVHESAFDQARRLLDATSSDEE